MTKRRAWRLVVAVVLLVGLALLVPGSPLYLPAYFSDDGQYDGRTTRAWVGDLASADVPARMKALYALGAIGARADDAVPAVARVMREDSDPGARAEAALALMKMLPASRAAVPALAEAIHDPEPAVRMNAAITLFRLGEEARPAVPALVQAVRAPGNRTNVGRFHFTIQDMAVRALGRAGAGDPEAVAALTAALESADTPDMHVTVLRALGELGETARPALPRLRGLLQNNNERVRTAAAETLRAVAGDAAAKADTPAVSASLELPEAERVYLWDIEHHGNVLVKEGFGRIADALKRADAAALSRLLAEDFAGSDLREPRRVRASAGYAEVERLQDAGRPPVPLDRAAFVKRLLELRKRFAGTPQVKMALMTLGPQKRGQLDGPWEGTAQLRLHGEHAPGAPAEVVAVLGYELPRPTKETLSQPGWLRGAGFRQVLQAKAPHYLFAEVAKKRGLDVAALHDNWKNSELLPVPGGVFVTDYNRDGILDVLVTDRRLFLYEGRPGGTFVDVTTERGLPRDLQERPTAAWVDLDGDGWDDLLVGTRVYRNENGRFADYTSRCNLHLPRDWENALVADYDGDGRLDLYVTRRGKQGKMTWLDGTTDAARGNYLFRNLGGWQFQDVTQASGTDGGHRSTFSAAWLDANNDGRPDLHVINEFGDGLLLINHGDGTFAEQALADRPADFGTMGVAVGDVNNDGNIDIYCANMYSKAGTRVIGNLAPDAYPPAVLERMRRFVAGSQLHLNRGGLKFDQAGKRLELAGVGWAYGACLADLDNDGWLDLYATAGFVSRDRDKPDG